MSLLDIDLVVEAVKEKSLPLCSYFLETRKNAKKKSVMSWLETCDDDTLKMINQYFDKTIKSEDTIQNLSQPESNNTKDIFDDEPEDETYHDSFEELEDEDDDMPVTDETDLVFLTILVYAWETNSKRVDEDKIDDAISQLVIYTSTIILMRLGLLEYNGKGGRFFDDSAQFIATKDGKKRAKELAKKKK